MVSVNQVKQFYAVKDVANATPTKVGDLQVVSVKVGSKDAVMCKYMGKGGLITTDYIVPDQVISAKAVAAEAFDKPLKQAVLELNSAVNSGAPVPGQDYVVDVQIRQYIALGEDSVLVKFGAVRTTVGMTASQFYVELAKSFARNFSRDINKFFKIYLADDKEDSTNWEEVTVSSSHRGTDYVAVVISEQSQEADYVRGEFPVTTVNFDVFPKEIVYNGDEVMSLETDGLSGAVKKEDKIAVGTTDTVVTIHNSYEIADTEYFCMGERGDQIRMMGYPNVIRTKYMLDSDALAKNGYDVLDINFYFVGRNHAVQKSEKGILFVAEGKASGGLNTVMTALKAALVTAGIEVE